MRRVCLETREKELVRLGRYISKTLPTPGEAALSRGPWTKLLEGEAGWLCCRATPQADETQYLSWIFSYQNCFLYEASSSVSTGLFFDS